MIYWSYYFVIYSDIDVYITDFYIYKLIAGMHAYSSSSLIVENTRLANQWISKRLQLINFSNVVNH